MKKQVLSLSLFLAAAGYGQSAIDNYLPDDNSDLTLALTGPTVTSIATLLPQTRSNQFASYVLTNSQITFGMLLGEVEALRMNKLVGASSGVSGTTSLVSRVAAPAVLGFGVEYGGILQQTNGTVTTLRGNLLGLSRLAMGEQQFRYCPAIDPKSCTPASRWLRTVSGSISFDRLDTANSETTEVQPADGTPPTVAQLFSSGSRMAAWGLRWDLTPSNNLDDPKYVSAWRAAIGDLRKAPQSAQLLKAISDLFQPYTLPNPDGSDSIYLVWKQQTTNLLIPLVGNKALFKQTLERQLDDLINQLSKADPQFPAKIVTLNRAFSNYFQVRDELIQKAQTHKLALEYTNQHPRSQPFFSNLRFIYSHQPSKSQTLFTLNAGLTWYHQTPTGLDVGKLRDVQVSGQLDRRLGQVPHFGYAVFTLAGYFQYLQSDSVVLLGPANTAPGTGIILPGTAATILGTKGAIGVAQAKLSIPVGNTMKIPFSVTWSNRTELITEKDIRAQVGITLDFDSLFH